MFVLQEDLNQNETPTNSNCFYLKIKLKLRLSTALANKWVRFFIDRRTRKIAASSFHWKNQFYHYTKKRQFQIEQHKVRASEYRQQENNYRGNETYKNVSYKSAKSYKLLVKLPAIWRSPLIF